MMQLANSTQRVNGASIHLGNPGLGRLAQWPSRVGEEELLAVDLEARNRGLPLWPGDPVDERLPKLLLDMRVLGRVHQDDPILVEQALIALDHDGEVAPVLEGEPRAPVRE